MGEIVSGWSDKDHVYLVERDGDRVGCRRLPARWSAFIRGMNNDDRSALQRSRDVVGLSPDGDYTRVDFSSRWARSEIVERVSGVIEGAKLSASLHDGPSSVGAGAGVFESDVNPLRRFLSDAPHVQIGNPRAVYLDLEVDPRKRFQEMTEGKARIIAWALFRLDGSESVKVASHVLEADTDLAERDHLAALFVALEAFDLVLAWSGDGFDFPVLEMRTSKLRVKLPNGKVPVWQRWCWLDHLEVFKKYNQAHESGEERSSFSLNAISQHLLGQGKVDYDVRRGWEDWEAGGDRRAELLRYCEHDTRLMPLIEAKTGFVALHVAVCQVTRCFPDSSSLGAAQQGDGFLLALGGQRGHRFPARPWFDDEAGGPDAFAGAYVMSPTRVGILDDVHVCDFAGLYPSIMRSWNMSPDTLISNTRAALETPHCRLPDRPVSFRTDRRGIVPEALDTLIAERAKYTKRADDAEPGSEDWHRFKRLSSAYKIIANSFYGIVGSPFTRFYDRTIAEGVTQTGAWLIKHVAATSQRAGLDPFYGDTDSVFVQGSADDFSRVVDTLNASWPGLLHDLGCPESRVKLEFEKSFSRLVLKSAKCYAGRYSRYKGKPAPADMKPEVRGLEYKRGDAIRWAREMQKEAIDRMLDVSRPAATSGEFAELVARWRDRVLGGEIAVDDIVLSQGVKHLAEYKERYTSEKCTGKVDAQEAGKKKKKSCGYEFGSKLVGEGVLTTCPKCKAERKVASQLAHVRVARILAERGELVTEGTKVEYLIVGRPDDEEDDGKLVAVPARDPGVLERIDRDYYWDRRIYPATERLLEIVFPDRDWADTAARRRKIAKEIASVEEKKRNRNKVDDLPLFGGESGPGPTIETVVREAIEEKPAEQPRRPPAIASPPLPLEEKAAAPAPAKVRRRKVEPSAAPAPTDLASVLVRVEVRSVPGEEPAESAVRDVALMEAIKATIEAYPGDRPVKLLLVGARVEGARATVEVPTGLSIATSATARSALIRLVGGKNVEGF